MDKAEISRAADEVGRGPGTRTIHVSRELHRQISILAAHREESIQSVTVRAIRAGLPTLDGSDELSAN